MRILIFSQYFWPESFRINDLARALVDAGHTVSVLSGKPNYPEGRVFAGYRAGGTARERFAGSIDVFRVPLFPRGAGGALRLALNYLSFILSAGVLAPVLLRGTKVDAIVVYAPSPLLQALPAILLARLKRVPLAVWVQDLWPESLSATGFVRNRLVLRAVEWLVRLVYRCADVVLVQSEAFRAPVARLTDDAGKIACLPNPVEAAAEADEGDAAAQALAQRLRASFSLVFAGNIGTAQAMETLVEAAELLRHEADIRIFVIGSGSRSAWVEAEVRRRRLANVELPGRFPPSAMPLFYRSAAALLATLRQDPIFAYTVPSKIQGYLAAGRPIIAAMDGEGARIVAAAGAGFSCPAEAPRALADAVLRLRALPNEAREALGRNGRAYAKEHFSLDRLASDLAAHLQRAVTNRENK